MKVTYIANGCAIYESCGFRLVSDPWLTNGAFEGSWCHYPPLRTKPEELAKLTDALYISHIHPDHFDPLSLAPMRRDIPVVVLDNNSSKFLHNRLRELGFKNIVGIRDKESKMIGPYRLTLFAPFEQHNFFDSKIGNLIDSGILIDDKTIKVLNLNDNVPRPNTASEIARVYGPIDLLQVQYCAAGPYPSCFLSLGEEGRQLACNELRERYLRQFVDNVKAVCPRYTMPFAGDFVLGGSQWKKNRVLGTLPPELAVERLRKECPEYPAILLYEGMAIDLINNKISGKSYPSYDYNSALNYIERELSKIQYPHELEVHDATELSNYLAEALPLARQNFNSWQRRLEFNSNINIYIDLGDDRLFHFNPALTDIEFIEASNPLVEPYLKCTMDPRLLLRILTRKAHWNNAEGGCHIDFHRVPDIYDPDLHTMLSFFHISRTE